jgi:hypothetical protein
MSSKKRSRKGEEDGDIEGLQVVVASQVGIRDEVG